MIPPFTLPTATDPLQPNKSDFDAFTKSAATMHAAFASEETARKVAEALVAPSRTEDSYDMTHVYERSDGRFVVLIGNEEEATRFTGVDPRNESRENERTRTSQQYTYSNPTTYRRAE
jgi:sugar/nucleoside kinase (ribokinase family)